MMAKLRNFLRSLKLGDLNKEQRKHLASAVNTVALGQLATFCYAALKENGGFAVIVASMVIFVILEVVALRVLSGVEDQTDSKKE
ncbi:hypothetical protein [Nitrogeniibacter aestuarii]|uniref:hypothetical protein n=1 Tax=Nitrogeniibacter aestuarii TaxID=2815343 RepID=UPI001E51A495|nr:hypothetical protein [Nitrogeniibacter aestuarii]